jgi:AmpD protein
VTHCILALPFRIDADRDGRKVSSREPSPNFDSAAEGTAIDLLVIHNISLPPGSFGGPFIADLFMNRLDYDADPYFDQLRPLRVSAHFLIRRDGAVMQFVSAHDRAWHAGASSFCGQERCNDFSIGIELEGHGLPAIRTRTIYGSRFTDQRIEAAYPLQHVDRT